MSSKIITRLEMVVSSFMDLVHQYYNQNLLRAKLHEIARNCDLFGNPIGWYISSTCYNSYSSFYFNSFNSIDHSPMSLSHISGVNILALNKIQQPVKLTSIKLAVMYAAQLVLVMM
eukprot:c21731_g3_i4.p1 GENE.c21731_g3_i4~~c21731_g3_i4.p1  ORF type:complete len:116 (-),score=0.84 c21731_g3_i4:347-694(-)